ncbi:MAG: NTP transferase domain-containing protein [Muribaculaceae bacterium]|nr:NTP transferase domain-containing protein [Muribaculaceae bacterium]
MNGLIFAAGIGSRLKPWTDFHPKALVEVGHKPMLQRVVENMKKAGIENIIINIHHMADQIVDFVKNNDSFGVNISFSNETDCLLDTGGAIVKASNLIGNNNPVMIHNADIYTDLDLSALMTAHDNAETDATLLTSHRESSRQLLTDNDGYLCGWINNSTGETIPRHIDNTDTLHQVSFNGIHIVNHTVIDWLRDNAPAKAFPIIPQYIAMSSKLRIKTVIPECDYIWVDIGKPASLEMARKIAQEL